MRLTAESIMRSFQTSHKKHLFLTGRRGAGKTSLLGELTPLLNFSGVLPGITTKVFPGDCVILEENGTGQTAVIGRYEKKADFPQKSTDSLASPSNQMNSLKQGFTELGIPALNRVARSASAWVSIDELGYLETNCLPFQDAVQSLLDKKRVIAILRKQDLPFLSHLFEREDAFVYDLDAPLPPIGCVIMASGEGRRFGSNKLTVPFHGKPMITSILESTSGELFSQRLVVTRHKEIVQISEQAHVPYLLHDLPMQSDTIRLGLEKLLQTAPLEGCIFCPSDQPLLRRETLETLALSFAKKPEYIFRPGFKETFAAPVIFGKRFFPELLTLPAGKGGSYLLQKYPGQIQTVPVRDAYELFDVDTKEELQTLLQINQPERGW